MTEAQQFHDWLKTHYRVDASSHGCLNDRVHVKWTDEFLGTREREWPSLTAFCEWLNTEDKLLERIVAGRDVEVGDLQSIRRSIQQYLNWDFSHDDVVAMNRLTEEAACPLSEDKALRRMKAISDKYPGIHKSGIYKSASS